MCMDIFLGLLRPVYSVNISLANWAGYVVDDFVLTCAFPLDRYTVKVTEDHLSTIQINTSKLDVYIKLVILDNEVEVATSQGKGHAVIPSFIFLKDLDPNEEKRPSSRACMYHYREVYFWCTLHWLMQSVVLENWWRIALRMSLVFF